ncbi:hypothetical protein Fmac_012399 [Flemingia macrophylla]|uniref:Uncharacterized protein n=1 Tax=Flemingia macrophylla TaxID=520843 RepID=A0ABD1MR20_9FABA
MGGATTDRYNTHQRILTLHNHKRQILHPYFHHIHAAANQINHQPNRDLRLFINNSNHSTWRSLTFMHPSTFEFDTIIMELDLKNRLKSDLDSFFIAKHYYHRLGRVCKRSFLFYGASSTSKSSLVAAKPYYKNTVRE